MIVYIFKGILRSKYTPIKLNTIIATNPNINDLIVCVSPAILDCCFSNEEEQFKKIFTDVWEEESEYIYIMKKKIQKDFIYLYHML